jgi:hypothetical protein
MKTLLCGLLLLLWNSLAWADPGATNLVGSRVFDRSLADVRAAIKTNIAFLPPQWDTNEVAGVRYEASFTSCNPPVSKGIWRQKVVPLLVQLGARPPVRVSFWWGRIVASRISETRTRVELFKNVSNPMTETDTGRAYMEKLEAALGTKKK